MRRAGGARAARGREGSRTPGKETGRHRAVQPHRVSGRPLRRWDGAMARSRWNRTTALAWRRLRERLWPIVQTAAAAVAAWYLARYVLGVHLPLFAPIAAVIALGASHGQQGRR